MATYQIPQFLDSGDKILGPLNVRQFGYALGGGFIGILVYTVTQNLLPGIGNYAFIPAIPFLIVAAYLALGKYNGRDTEVYVLKIVLYLIKPRIMKFAKVPDVSDLNNQQSKVTFTNILNEFNKRVANSKEAEENILTAFSTKDSRQKAVEIRKLGTILDTSLRNSLTQTLILENRKLKSQNEINKILQKPSEIPYSPSPLINAESNPNLLSEASARSKFTNFFDKDELHANSHRTATKTSKLENLKQKYNI